MAIRYQPFATRLRPADAVQFGPRGSHPSVSHGGPPAEGEEASKVLSSNAPAPAAPNDSETEAEPTEVIAVRPLSTIAAILLLALLVSSSLGAPTIQAKRAETRPPIIDGDVLLDAAWINALTAADFKLLGKPGMAPTQTTQAKVLFDEHSLYVAFVCNEDQMGKLVAQVKAFDGPTWQDDCVELFLSPFADRTRYYHFVVNAAGVLRDELGQDEKWNSGARVATKRGGTSWSAEIAIPFAALGLDETTASAWAVNFCREERPHGEISSWAPCESGFHEPKSFGELRGIGADFAPLVAAGLHRRVARTTDALHGIQKKAREYGEVELGRTIIGACDRHADELASIQRALSRRLDSVQVRGLGEKVARVEADAAELQARLVKLPMLRAAGRAGYAVCAESTMTKVRPDKPYGGKPAPTVRVSLARNEYEATQLVVVPLEETLRKVAVSVSDLRGPRRAVLPAERININVVGYVNVKQKSGRAPMEPGLLPDPLLPNDPVDIDRARVQSWWITVHTPKDQRAGLYRGKISVRPQNAPETQINLHVRVWGFTLPTTSRLRSSYGINQHYVFSKYDVAPGPGQPTGWVAGSWQGADMEGRPDYFGSMNYDIAFDYEIKKSGKRSCRVRVTEIHKGTSEWPRFCYYTPPLELAPNTDYEFSVWYRTKRNDKHGPSGYFGPAGVTSWPPTGGEWKQGKYAFNTGDKQGIRVYLKVDKVGTVWFDQARLALKGVASSPNLLPNPDFEKGDETARERIRDAYFLNALHHRASPTSLIGPKITTSADGQVAMDWAEFDEKMQLYVDNGLSAFNVFWCQLPSGWGKVESVQDEARLTRARELLRQTQAHLDEKDWTRLAYIYTIDEPGWKSFPQVKQAFELAHSAAPKLKTLLTYGYGASKPIEPGAPRYADLAGYVDIHVPHSDCYEPVYLKKRQQIGDEIWAYVCISAQRPYLNCWGIDYPGMDHRLLFWQFFDHDITGFLYWQITYWKVDPWQDTLTYPGGNGDGSLIYPGKEGPVDSIRWELCRDGTEDYDMLVMFRDATTALGARGAKVATDPYLQFPHLTRSWTEYSEAPELLEKQRLLVGDRLELLTRRLER